MGATFDCDIMQGVGAVISEEARAKLALNIANGNRARYAGLTFWTPNINIFPDPCWGRGLVTNGESG